MSANVPTVKCAGINRRVRACVLLALTGGMAAYWYLAVDHLPRLGATTTVTELTSGLSLEARVDTGAQICSIHCDAIEIQSPGSEPMENVGKTVRFKIEGTNGDSAWIKARLVDHSAFRTSTLTVRRYIVNLPLRVDGVEATVLVNLNDRHSMRYPFLIGRNFLCGRFVVDVRDSNDELESQ
jgi:hypothetical protein